MHACEMISTHLHGRGNANDALIRCIEECYDCAQTGTTGAGATRRSGPNEAVIRAMLEACATACRKALQSMSH